MKLYKEKLKTGIDTIYEDINSTNMDDVQKKFDDSKSCIRNMRNNECKEL